MPHGFTLVITTIGLAMVVALLVFKPPGWRESGHAILVVLLVLVVVRIVAEVITYLSEKPMISGRELSVAEGSASVKGSSGPRGAARCWHCGGDRVGVPELNRDAARQTSLSETTPLPVPHRAHGRALGFTRNDSSITWSASMTSA